MMSHLALGNPWKLVKIHVIFGTRCFVCCCLVLNDYAKVRLEEKEGAFKTEESFSCISSLLSSDGYWFIHVTWCIVRRPCNILKDFMARAVGYPIRDSIPFLIGLHSADQMTPEPTSTLFNSRGVTGMYIAIHRGAQRSYSLSLHICVNTCSVHMKMHLQDVCIVFHSHSWALYIRIYILHIYIFCIYRYYLLRYYYYDQYHY